MIIFLSIGQLCRGDEYMFISSFSLLPIILLADYNFLDGTVFKVPTLWVSRHLNFYRKINNENMILYMMLIFTSDGS